MNSDSIRLVLAGGMIALLALSAAAYHAVRPPSPEGTAAAVSEAREGAGGEVLVSVPHTGQNGTEATEPAFGEAAVPVLAEDDPAAGPFTVGLRITEPIRGEKLFVCDRAGCPLEEIVPDAEGDAALGPLAPGQYGIFRGQTEIGSFRLLGNAAPAETRGRLWTDGELLHLERFVPGTVRLTVLLPGPGDYSLLLYDRDGRVRAAELYLSEGAAADREETWVRTVEFRGLPAGLYTAVCRGTPLGQTEVLAGETAELRVKIEK